MRHALPIALVAVWFVASPSFADEPAPLPRKELDARLNESLRSAISLGARLYNSGREEECCRVYQGALTVTVPLLDHYAELKKSVASKIKHAETLTSTEAKAFALREAIDEIRLAIRSSIPLWHRLGGEAAVRAILSESIKIARSDPKVNFSRAGKFQATPETNAKTVQLLVELLSSATGGPHKYSGRDMKTAHKGMGITHAEFDALGAVVVKVMKDFKVADKEISEVEKIVESLRSDIVEEKSLWERLGGEPVVVKVFKETCDSAVKDPKVDLTRGGKFPMTPEKLAHMEKMLVDYVSSVSRGPKTYSGKSMRTAHTGMAITEAQFDAFVAHLEAALKKNNVPQRESEELLTLIRATKRDIVQK